MVRCTTRRQLRAQERARSLGRGLVWSDMARGNRTSPVTWSVSRDVCLPYARTSGFGRKVAVKKLSDSNSGSAHPRARLDWLQVELQVLNQELWDRLRNHLAWQPRSNGCAVCPGPVVSELPERGPQWTREHRVGECGGTMSRVGAPLYAQCCTWSL